VSNEGGSRIRRSQLLLEHSRPELAEAELRTALSADPNDWLAHALLAISLRQLDRLSEATSEAEAAIHLAPDVAFPHYALATVLHARDRLDPSLSAIQEALRLDPREPDYHSRLAAIRFDQRRWQDALDASDRGLEIDPEHVPSNNVRAMALVKLGRRDEAGATIATALASDPDNALTHANQGWTLLHGGDALGASNHFREALRLDPNSSWARDGIITALKARNPIYALLLRWSLWMARLDRRAQWGVILVGYFGYRFLIGLGRTSPALGIVVAPLVIAYVLFALLTWIGDPIFTLLLRLDRFGRMVVTDEQRERSNLVGAALFAAVLSLGVLLALDRPSNAVLAALALAAQAIPLASIYRMPRGWPRRTMTGLAGVLAALALLGTGLSIAAPGVASATGVLGLALIGTFASTWVVNLLVMARPRR